MRATLLASATAASRAGLLDHGRCPDHEQAPQVLVAGTRDLAKPRLARSGMVLGVSPSQTAK